MMLSLVVFSSCLTPQVTPGWNVLSNSSHVPTDNNTQWFIVGQDTLVTDSRVKWLTHSWPQSGGKYVFEFQLPTGATELKLTFTDNLQGAKIDVSVFRAQSVELNLVDSKRIRGTNLRVELPQQNLSNARVTVHHHFRRAPVLRDAPIQWKGVISPTELGIAAHTGDLVFKVEAGQQIELCSQSESKPHLSLN